MSKLIFVMAAVVGLSACEAYPGRTTNCWGGSALSFAATDIPAGDCDHWIVISDDL